MMPRMLSLLPGSSQFNLATILADPLLELLPAPIPVLTGDLHREPFSKASTSKIELKQETKYEKNPENAKLCHVCETPGAAPHYGGIVCGGCKIFFARAVQKKLYYVCEKNATCPMPSGKRSKCRYCRFQLCLRVKMCPEEVGKLRELKMPEQLLIPKEEGSVVSYFDSSCLQSVSSSLPSPSSNRSTSCEAPAMLESRDFTFSPSVKDINMLSEERFRLFKQLSNQFSTTNQIRGTIRQLVNAERCCDNSACSSSTSPPNVSCSLSVALDEALRNPLLICERTPLYWHKAKTSVTPERFKQAYCRLVLHYLEFLGSIEDLYQMMEKQRMALIAARACSTILLTVVYNSYRFDVEGLSLGDLLVKEEAGSAPLSDLLSSIRHLLFQKMIELNVNEEEYVLLKLMNIFTLDEPMLYEGSEIVVRTLRFKYERLLMTLIQNSSSEWEKVKILRRIEGFYEFLANLTDISQAISSLAPAAIISNIADLNGQLSYDLHIRRYE